MAKKKKRIRTRMCNCWECQEGREDLKRILDKNRYFIQKWHNKAFNKIAKHMLQIRLFLDLEKAKRKGANKDGKKGN